MSNPWHAYREEVFAVMRQIDEAVQHAWTRARDLGPRGGSIAVGSADLDYTLKATVGEQYLRILRTGGDTEAAFSSSIEAGQEAIAKWNSRGCLSRAVIHGRNELHRDKCGAESIALGFHARFQKFREVKPTPASPVPSPAVQSRVRFAPAIVDGSGYCGPTCLSALTGIGTRQIARVLRSRFALRAVRGLTVSQMQWFIEAAGYQFAPTSVTPNTIDSGRAGDGVYLVELENHWMLWRGSKIICTEFSGHVRDVSDSKYRHDRVVATYEITGEVSESAFRDLVTPQKTQSSSAGQLALF